jgi:hypothetical protein
MPNLMIDLSLFELAYCEVAVGLELFPLVKLLPRDIFL